MTPTDTNLKQDLLEILCVIIFKYAKVPSHAAHHEKVETQDVPKVAKLVLWQGIVALEASI